MRRGVRAPFIYLVNKTLIIVMNSIKKYISGLGRTTRVLVLAIAVVIAGAGVTQAATTISTNISTAGTLSVTGLATLLGGATTTQITLLSGDTIKNASASSTVISGALQTTGGFTGTTGTFSSTLGITGLATFLGGASTTQFTLLSGDTIKNASASSTVISGALNTTGALSSSVGVSGTTGTFSSTLGVTGLATFLGGASTTQFTLLSGDTIKNAVASTTSISGNLTLPGGTSAGATLTVTNNATATSSLVVGCMQTTATSSATNIRLVFSTAGATSTFAGTAYWSYGTCPL